MNNYMLKILLCIGFMYEHSKKWANTNYVCAEWLRNQTSTEFEVRECKC